MNIFHKHSVCPTVKSCGAFEHDIWVDLIEGKFEILSDPATENPGSAYSPEILTVCHEIVTSLFDMESGLGTCFHLDFTSHIWDTGDFLQWPFLVGTPILKTILCISSKIILLHDNRVLHRRFKSQHPRCIWGRDKVALIHVRCIFCQILPTNLKNFQWWSHAGVQFQNHSIP